MVTTLVSPDAKLPNLQPKHTLVQSEILKEAEILKESDCVGSGCGIPRWDLNGDSPDFIQWG